MDKLGIVFSSRVRSALLCVLALWILVMLSTSAAQIIVSYINGQGFDTPIQTVILIDILIFLPYYVVAAVILRSLAARIALFHLLRRQIVVPEYSPTEVLSPAEVGLLVDNDFSLNEVAATLKDLELRGCIRIGGSGSVVELHSLSLRDTSDIERQFLQTLFQNNDRFTINGPTNANLLLKAGKQLANNARNRLVLGGQLPRQPAIRKLVRSIFNIFVGFAFLLQLLLTFTATNPNSQIFSVGYPRYPMNISELILEAVIVLAVLIIISSGFWQHSLADDHGLKNWRYVAGLKMFIEKTYKDRFYRDGHQMATDNDLRAYYPYAIALGIERHFTEKLKRSLLL
jgi:hypothetical protein